MRRAKDWFWGQILVTELLFDSGMYGVLKKNFRRLFGGATTVVRYLFEVIRRDKKDVSEFMLIDIVARWTFSTTNPSKDIRKLKVKILQSTTKSAQYCRCIQSNVKILVWTHTSDPVVPNSTFHDPLPGEDLCLRSENLIPSYYVASYGTRS